MAIESSWKADPTDATGECCRIALRSSTLDREPGELPGSAYCPDPEGAMGPTIPRLVRHFFPHRLVAERGDQAGEVGQQVNRAESIFEVHAGSAPR